MIERLDEGLKGLNVAVLKHYCDGADGSIAGYSGSGAGCSGSGASGCGKGEGRLGYAGSGHLYLVRLLGKTREQTNEVITKMAERRIACNVHYKPLPMMTAYKALGADIANYPNAYKFFENEITLPLHTCLTDEDVEYVIENFVEVVKEF